MKTINHSYKVGLFWLGLALMILCSILATSCMSIEKATQKVLLDPKARHNVFLKESEIFPCANDSSLKIITGKTDSVVVSSLFGESHLDKPDFFKSDSGSFSFTKPSYFNPFTIDTSTRIFIEKRVVDKTIDSLNKSHTKECNAAIDAAFKKGAMVAWKEFSSLKVPGVRVDTAVYSVVDKRKQQIDTDSINNLNRRVAVMQQQLLDCTDAGKKIDKDKNKYLLILIAVVFVSGAGFATIAYYKFFKIPKT